MQGYPTPLSDWKDIVTARGLNFGWLSTLAEFAHDRPDAIRDALLAFVRDASPEQIDAWGREIPVVRDAAQHSVTSFPPSRLHSVLLEYELPREGGRRPDVILLGNGTILVLEFKGKDMVNRADLDQVAAYARDLRGYHSMSHDQRIVPALIPMWYRGTRARYDDVEVLPPRELGTFVFEHAQAAVGPLIPGAQWADAAYEPLPGLVEAARLIFNNRPLPFIRQARSAGIPQALDYLSRTAHVAAATRTRQLALLTGVPGAGKTLVGLQLVHDRRLEDLVEVVSGRPRGAPAVFLSGNGPLVDVLRHALQGDSGEEKIFVNGIKSYLKQYVVRKRQLVPPEHIVVFDEAQRAWDREMISEKHEVDASEPDLVIQLANSIPGWSMVLGLVGEGQEIHKGEEAGLSQWADAIRHNTNSEQWEVHAAPKLAGLFPAPTFRFNPVPELDLTTTLRSHLASSVHAWVGALLSSSRGASELSELASLIRREGFVMYVTRDLGKAADYVRERYRGQIDKRFGYVASSRARNLEAIGIDNSFNATRQTKPGPWYNDPPGSPFSCCQLLRVVTEFQAQGLELDCPLVCWGDDLTHDGTSWRVAARRLDRRYRDPEALRVNSYRVLLTRGRDGFLVFVPPDRGNGMDSTAAHLEACGLRAL